MCTFQFQTQKRCKGCSIKPGLLLAEWCVRKAQDPVVCLAAMVRLLRRYRDFQDVPRVRVEAAQPEVQLGVVVAARAETQAELCSP